MLAAADADAVAGAAAAVVKVVLIAEQHMVTYGDVVLFVVVT